MILARCLTLPSFLYFNTYRGICSWPCKCFLAKFLKSSIKSVSITFQHHQCTHFPSNHIPVSLSFRDLHNFIVVNLCGGRRESVLCGLAKLLPGLCRIPRWDTLFFLFGRTKCVLCEVYIFPPALPTFPSLFESSSFWFLILVSFSPLLFLLEFCELPPFFPLHP